MEYNGPFPSKKDKMLDSPPRRHCVSHSHFDRADFCGEGTVHFRSSSLEVNRSLALRSHVTNASFKTMRCNLADAKN